MGARDGSGFSRRRRIALAVALVLLAALLAVWLLRKSIAGRYVDRTLAAAKVPARYTITDLGLGAQRLTNVVIGDPAHPDLVADWIETRTRITSGGPELSGVRAGRLRLRGQLIDGGLSLGAIDRLLPASTGGPVSLPPLDLDVEDGRMRLETPYGVAGVSLRGSGRLDGGFDGRVAVASERLGTGACVGERIAAALAVRSLGRDRAGHGRVRLTGPVNLAQARCAGARLAAFRSKVAATLVVGARSGSTLTADIRTGAITEPRASAGGMAGKLALLHQGGRDVTVQVDLAASRVRGFGVGTGRLALNGGVEARDGAVSYAGNVAVADADVAALVPRTAGSTAGTPVEPLVDRAGAAAVAAARRVSGEMEVGLFRGDDWRLSARDAVLRSASGARLTMQPESLIEWRSSGALSLNGGVRLAGGGLPNLVVRGSRAAGEPVRATLTVAPYAAGGASLALTPVTIAGNRLVTRATLSGPIPGGRVEGLTVPLDLRLTGNGLVANPACTPVGFERFAISSLRLQPARLRLCPTGAALIRVAKGVASGGARLRTTRLAGTLGSTPVALGFAGATLRLADRGFALEKVETRLGRLERVTRLDFARLGGRVERDGIAGTFAGGAGQIANVPLLLADAAGDWRFAGGALRVNGALGVSDAQTAAARFQPMQVRGVSLALVDNAITASGTLHEPTTGTKVADLAIRHALGPGTGGADLTVSNITFGKGFQPELLTRLTFGIVADVAGTVAGEGHIVWSPEGVTSAGTFRTARTDLAAAFGPVTGLAGELRFTDLLALESAPDQVATIASVNPGIAVTDGTIRYRLLPNTRVRVEGGDWPFAGGRLLLDPTTLDFSAAAERRMTFRVDGVAADRFLQQFDFKNLDATGTFDGVLPMVFDASGGRIENGHMTVREGGGTIRYVGDLSEKDLGFWGDFAFQALKSLRYRSLRMTMNGPLAGEMITDVRFAGVSQGQGAKSNFLIRRLQRLPLVFNVRIKAPFRGLLDSAQGFYDPSRLIRRNLPRLIEEQNRVQPPASGLVPKKEQP